MESISIRQVKAARALLDWSQADLAKASGVSEQGIKRRERDTPTSAPYGGRPETVSAIREALESAGIAFITDDEGEGVRLRASSGGGTK